MDKKIVIHNQLISYTIHKEGNTPLLFLHGWRSEETVWQPVIQKLKKTDYGLVSFDFPGFGESEIPKKPFSLDDYCEMVRALVQELGLKRVILVGHSFGGRVAIKCAAHNPEIIQKLVLVDSAGIKNKSMDKTIMRGIAKIIKPLFVPGFMQPLRKKIYTHIGAEDYVATPALQKTFVNIIKEDLTPLFPKIKQPTLIIWGDKDTETPLSYRDIMAQRIPHARVVTLKDAGHYSFLDKPQKFCDALKSFL